MLSSSSADAVVVLPALWGGPRSQRVYEGGYRLAVASPTPPVPMATVIFMVSGPSWCSRVS
eukprot:537728-Prymnesium_polylepis.2